MTKHTVRAVGTSLILAFALAACAGDPPRPSASPADAKSKAVLPASDDVTIQDHRPAKDKSFAFHSLWITSCDYGVYTVGDNTAGTPVMTALHDDLTAIQGHPLSGRTVELTHYIVYYNPSRKLKGAAIGSIGGIAGAVIGSSTATIKGSSCAASKMDGGWYATEEVKHGYPPLIIEIVASVDGKVHKSRTVYSPMIDLSPKMRAAGDVKDYNAAIKAADADFIKTLDLVASSSPAARSPTAPAASPTPSPANASPNAQYDSGWINMPASGSK